MNMIGILMRMAWSHYEGTRHCKHRIPVRCYNSFVSGDTINVVYVQIWNTLDQFRFFQATAFETVLFVFAVLLTGCGFLGKQAWAVEASPFGDVYLVASARSTLCLCRCYLCSICMDLEAVFPEFLGPLRLGSQTLWVNTKRGFRSRGWLGLKEQSSRSSLIWILHGAPRS
jgi:hypothetical protein